MLDSRCTCVGLPDVDGNPCVLKTLKMPMMLTNRNVCEVFYFIENDDGSIIFVVSSRGNESIIEANADKIKKNVIANCIINYTRLTPTETGCDWVSV